MQKLINAFKADRSLKNATKLADYDARHCMAACFLSDEDLQALRDAVVMVAFAKLAA